MSEISEIMKRYDRLSSFLSRVNKPFTVDDVIRETGLKRYEALGALHLLEWLGVVVRHARGVYTVNKCKYRDLMMLWGMDCITV